jgi:hypothetical protein
VGENPVIVHDIWDRLKQVSELAFQAQSHSVLDTGWNGAGKAQVRVEEISPSVLLYHENGTWKPTSSNEIVFTNIYRWTLGDQSIRLEHLRQGPDKPVYLFDLVPASEQTLSSAKSHLCGQDRYSARLELESGVITFNWVVLGPKKDEKIVYRYT